MTDFAALRRRFPVLARKTYLNSGSYCALADSVRDAINAYMEDRLQVGANWDVWVEKNEAVRSAMAAVLRASPEEVAITASASAGINALASAFRFDGHLVAPIVNQRARQRVDAGGGRGGDRDLIRSGAQYRAMAPRTASFLLTQTSQFAPTCSRSSM